MQKFFFSTIEIMCLCDISSSSAIVQ
ncbi:CLUMA_CG005096, isoform A [Clunio marinus]|uniref:CLUMA_CG005096, isoform A n=1 Tax=Clunio marinus TaxID=568069 RepID=A0A1J1HTM6_9DIPT|nr:CLUMA_CG005096, isoform A [Clunio marinus]